MKEKRALNMMKEMMSNVEFKLSEAQKQQQIDREQAILNEAYEEKRHL